MEHFQPTAGSSEDDLPLEPLVPSPCPRKPPYRGDRLRNAYMFRKPSGRSRAARWKKQGSDDAGSAALAVALFAKTKLARLYQAKPGTQRTHALGDRALPDSMAAANAADPKEGFVRASFKASFFVVREVKNLTNSSSMHDIICFLWLVAVGAWVQMFRK